MKVWESFESQTATECRVLLQVDIGEVRNHACHNPKRALGFERALKCGSLKLEVWNYSLGFQGFGVIRVGG